MNFDITLAIEVSLLPLLVYTKPINKLFSVNQASATEKSVYYTGRPDY